MRVTVRPEEDRVVLEVHFSAGGGFNLTLDVVPNALLAGEWESIARAVETAYRRGAEDCAIATLCSEYRKRSS